MGPMISAAAPVATQDTREAGLHSPSFLFPSLDHPTDPSPSLVYATARERAFMYETARREGYLSARAHVRSR